MIYSSQQVRRSLIISWDGSLHALANRQPSHRCFGHRPYDPTTKTFGPYEWIDYQTVQKRRADFGVGLVELHRLAGVTGEKYPVGLWCQNRPEWPLTGDIHISCLIFFELTE